MLTRDAKISRHNSKFTKIKFQKFNSTYNINGTIRLIFIKVKFMNSQMKMKS